MNVFNAYSQYYDLIYRDKDYNAEVEYIDLLIKNHKSEAESLLELGCGTGKHAELLLEKGYEVHGIDASDAMLEKAQKRQKDGLRFEKGDARTYRTDKKFDAVISLFHVASYQTSNQDLKNYFLTAREHLNEGGIFIFDCWYGPAVLTERPSERIKELEDEKISVKRYAKPLIHVEKNVVDVHYTVDITDKETGETQQLKEVHSMRYLFTPEIELFLEAANFKLISCQEWLTGNSLSFGTWSVCFVARAV